MAGDALDLLSPTRGFGRSLRKIRRLLTLASVVGITAIDVVAVRHAMARSTSPAAG